VHNFLYGVAKTSNFRDDLLRAGILVLTVDHRPERKTSIASRLTSDLGWRWWNKPKSYHDFVLVGNDGQEVRAHKFALAGQCSSKQLLCSCTSCDALFHANLSS
jgi:hypothetical protein